jgi:hypothetical protein
MVNNDKTLITRIRLRQTWMLICYYRKWKVRANCSLRTLSSALVDVLMFNYFPTLLYYLEFKTHLSLCVDFSTQKLESCSFREFKKLLNFSTGGGGGASYIRSDTVITKFALFFWAAKLYEELHRLWRLFRTRSLMRVK